MSLNLVADFDLSVLVEEVTEAIFAGRIFNRQRRSERVKNTGITKVFSPRKSTESLPSQNEISNSDTEVVRNNVAVMLSINREENWNVRAQPGALRRIIMNLLGKLKQILAAVTTCVNRYALLIYSLGNALKYTTQGFVEVSLKSKREAKQYSRLSVELRFTDSGKGMSEEYQRDRLFRPFSQEDPFAEGTGLGLSIVRQIVESLKGKIRVKSQQGVGTDVVVSFSLPRVSTEGQISTQIPTQVLEATKGLKIALIAPRNTKRMSEAARRLQATLRESCEEWFEANVVVLPQFEEGQSAVAICLEALSIEYLLAHLDGEDVPQNPTPVIVLCSNPYDCVALKKQVESMVKSLRRIQVISQP